MAKILKMSEETKFLKGKDIQVITWAAPHHIRFVIDKFQTGITTNRRGKAYTKLYLDLNPSKGEFNWSVRQDVIDNPLAGGIDVGGGLYKEFKTFAGAHKHFESLRKKVAK